MGILQSTIRFLGRKGEDDDSSEKSCYIPASLYKVVENLLLRKSDPIIPVKNPLVSGRNHTFVQEISSPVATYKTPAYLNPETEAHVASSTSACVSPADLESQRDLSKLEVESHFGFSTCYYVPPSDLELQRDYSSSEDDVYRHNAEQLDSHKVEQLAPPPTILEHIWEEGSNYSTLAPSLAHINALDLVDSAVITENQINKQSPESDDDDHHQKVKTCLVSDAGKWIKHYNGNHGIPRKSDQILPLKNPLVSSRNQTFVPEISSPDATYEALADFINPETLSHVPSYAAARVPPADLERQKDLSNAEIEPHFSFFASYAPPSHLEFQRDYSYSEDEQVYRHMAEEMAASSAIMEHIWEEGSNYSTLAPSLAYRNAFDSVDSAVFTEYEKNEQSPESDEELSLKTGLVSEAGKWIKHYNSNHGILLVGEGDFSFSACLAVAFGSAPYILATSLDSAEDLKKNYKHAMNNIQKLTCRKSRVMHEIDATNIASHPFLGEVAFDRIVYNFPFAGFFKNLPRQTQLRKHRRLVSLFMKNAKEMLTENGEIHISHKTNGFHKEWKLEDLASCHGLILIEAVKFTQSDYPGYHTKCGFGSDNNFNCNPSKTYKFGLKRRASLVF